MHETSKLLLLLLTYAQHSGNLFVCVCVCVSEGSWRLFTAIRVIKKQHLWFSKRNLKCKQKCEAKKSRIILLLAGPASVGDTNKRCYQAHGGESESSKYAGQFIDSMQVIEGMPTFTSRLQVMSSSPAIYDWRCFQVICWHLLFCCLRFRCCTNFFRSFAAIIKMLMMLLLLMLS